MGCNVYIKKYGSYKQFLLERTQFKSYCCTVIDTSTEVVFNKFLSNDNDETDEQINIHCQALMTQIFICYETSMSNAKSKTMCNFCAASDRILVRKTDFSHFIELQRKKK